MGSTNCFYEKNIQKIFLRDLGYNSGKKGLTNVTESSTLDVVKVLDIPLAFKGYVCD